MNKKKIINLPKNEKLILLKALGYTIDSEDYIINETDRKRVEDKYSNCFVKLDNASVLPGSTIIIDTNSFSLSEYFEEYRE